MTPEPLAVRLMVVPFTLPPRLTLPLFPVVANVIVPDDANAVVVVNV